jgi:putative transposase
VIADEGSPVEVACRVLGVSVSGYYYWRVRPPSARAVRHAWLTDVIREVHTESYGSYGARRVYAELTLGRGIQAATDPQTVQTVVGRPAHTRARPVRSLEVGSLGLNRLVRRAR